MQNLLSYFSFLLSSFFFFSISLFVIFRPEKVRTHLQQLRVDGTLLRLSARTTHHPVLFRASNKPLHRRNSGTTATTTSGSLATVEDWEKLATDFGLVFRTLSAADLTVAGDDDGGVISVVEMAICEQAEHFIGAWGSTWSAMVEQRRVWIDTRKQPGIYPGNPLSIGDNFKAAARTAGGIRLRAGF